MKHVFKFYGYTDDCVDIHKKICGNECNCVLSELFDEVLMKLALHSEPVLTNSVAEFEGDTTAGAGYYYIIIDSCRFLVESRHFTSAKE
jgi:hypothetical protein